MTDVLVDGRPGEAVGVFDRGLHYGDGLFETMAIRNGRVPLLQRHLGRLEAGGARLHLTLPPRSLLEGEILEFAATHSSGVLKLIVTRGPGGRGYRPSGERATTRILLRYPEPAYPPSWREQGVRLQLCATRLGINPALAGLKHLNRLEQVLARSEWSDPEVAEGLMLDTAGTLVEGTMTNVFLVLDQKLVTPSLEHCGVAGVMRGLLLEVASRLGLQPEVRTVMPEELEAAEEVFVCNAVIGIWPVAAIGERRYTVGAITRRLLSAIDEHLE